MYLQTVGSNGTYTHTVAEVALSVSEELLFDEANRPTSTLKRWAIQGQLQAASATALTTAMAALTIAYNGTLDRVELYEDGGTLTHHALYASLTIDGIRVIRPPSFPQGGRDQYVIVRDYTIELEAEVPNTAASNIISFQESVSRTGGGGPRIVAIETRDSEVRMQQVSKKTPVFIVQSGRAVGRFFRPSAPAPLLPLYENSPEQRITHVSPRRRGRAEENYTTEWEYHMILPVKVNVSPNRWPA